jgi:hypothetical protein
VVARRDLTPGDELFIDRAIEQPIAVHDELFGKVEGVFGGDVKVGELNSGHVRS